jgi:HSP20 family molecular chaperone IbpA
MNSDLIRYLLNDGSCFVTRSQYNTANPFVLHAFSRIDEGNIMVGVEIPGFKEEEISLSIEKNVLVIDAKNEAKTRYGKFSLAKKVVPDQAKAVLENGVLTITLPIHPDEYAVKIPISKI